MAVVGAPIGLFCILWFGSPATRLLRSRVSVCLLLRSVGEYQDGVLVGRLPESCGSMA